MEQVAYRTYWLAWLTLLVITLGMVFVQLQAVLVLGMIAKATIIGAWFMHLRYERLEFTIIIMASIFVTALILFGLIVPDGLAM